MKIFFLFLLGVAAPALALDDNNAHVWFMYNGDHAFGRGARWGFHGEAQWRRSDTVLKWQQAMFRPALNYDLAKNITLTFGYAFADTFRYGDYPVLARFPEHRAFQQLLYTKRIQKLDFQNRFRLEQRYIGQPALQPDGTFAIDSYRYENRIRYMLRTNIPLRFGGGRNFIGLYNEIMFNFGKNVLGNVFDQNRAFVSFGRNLGYDTRVELAFMEQTLQRRGGLIYEHNHTIQIIITSRLPFGN